MRAWLPRRQPPDPTRRTTAVLGAVACLLMVATPGGADGPGPGTLDTPVSAAWTGVPLRAWAGRMAALVGRPVVVDRRLDPDTLVTRSCHGEPAAAVLAEVAHEAGGTAEPLRSWVRICPAAERGRATRGERDRTAEIARLSAASRTRLAAREPWTWGDGARPRELVSNAAAAAGLSLDGLDRVPHDHLPAAVLAPLSIPERLDLVLAHYDLRVSWAGAEHSALVGTIVPLAGVPAPLAAVAEPPAGGSSTARARQPGQPPEPRGASGRYTLNLEAPLDKAIEALAPRLGLEPALDLPSLAARGILPGEIVRTSVTDATREQVLDALVAPLGLRWRIEGRRLIVDAPPR